MYGRDKKGIAEINLDWGGKDFNWSKREKNKKLYQKIYIEKIEEG